MYICRVKNKQSTMSKTKLLFLSAVTTVLSEKGKKKVEGVQSEDSDDLKIGGLTRSQYVDLGLPLPSEFNAVDDEGYLELEEDETEEIVTDIIVDREYFVMAAENEEYTKVLLKNDMTITVIESVDEIFGQIHYLDRTWLDEVKSKWQTILHKIKIK